MNIQESHVAPEESKCVGCWEPLAKADREGGSSYAKVQVYSKGRGETQSLVLYLCTKCSTSAVSSIYHSKVGTLILSDAIEGSIRTLIRLNGELTKAVTE